MNFADFHVPLFDLDGDTHSDFQYFRGYNWKGIDCNDLNKYIRPGRKEPVSEEDNIGQDYNCNGIHGIDKKSGKPYKDLYCKDSH